METQGREHHEGEIAGEASELRYRETTVAGSKSTFLLSVSLFWYLPRLSVSKGYIRANIRVNIRGRGSP